MRALVVLTLTLLGAPAMAEIVSGELSPPADGEPVDVAATWLATTPLLGDLDATALRAVGQTALEGGQGVKLMSTWRGLDVVGGEIYVRLDDDGRVRWASGRAVSVPEVLDDVPSFDANRLGDQVQISRLFVYAPPGREARLAWEVGMPRDRLGVMRTYVDAHSGEILHAGGMIRRSGSARVFASNPTASQLSVVTLPLPAGASALSGPDIVALNCVDKKTCPLRRSGQSYRFCETLPLAAADSAGDFLYDRPSSDTALEDPFAEVQMYYHATRGLDLFKGLGFAGLAEPLQAVVNLRIPERIIETCTGTGPSNITLEPNENAFFAPAGSLIPGTFPPTDSMLFGQGMIVDYAYDGDVIYHELTHAVMDVLTPLSSFNLDEAGFDPTPFGLHEGLADYFAAVFSGDPNIAEYVGPVHTDEPQLRTLLNERRCPENLVGEEHVNSQMWSAALWQIRNALATAVRPAFDRAVFTAIDSFGSVESYDTARQKILAEMELTMGASAAGTARGIFAGRGLDGCNGRVLPLDLGQTKSGLYLKGPDEVWDTTAVPAPVQFRFELTKAAQRITLFIGDSAAGSEDSGTPVMTLLVKPSAPVRWNLTDHSNDASAMAAVTLQAMGDKHPGTATVTGSFAPGVYHAQLVNGGATWVVLGLYLATNAEGPGSGDGTDTTGCAVGGGAGGGAALALLAILLAPLVRRGARRARRWRDRPARAPSPRA